MKKERSSTKPERPQISFDMPVPWKAAMQKYVLPNYPEDFTTTALMRSILKEFISCFMTEQEMRDEALLPLYRSQGKPELLLAAIRKSEETRRENDGTQTATTASRKAAVGRK